MSSDALNVWVVDDDQSVRWVLEKALRQADMQTRSFERAEHLLEAIETVQRGEPAPGQTEDLADVERSSR